jgi:hypothetical protein
MNITIDNVLMVSDLQKAEMNAAEAALFRDILKKRALIDSDERLLSIEMIQDGWKVSIVKGQYREDPVTYVLSNEKYKYRDQIKANRRNCKVDQLLINLRIKQEMSLFTKTSYRI